MKLLLVALSNIYRTKRSCFSPTYMLLKFGSFKPLRCYTKRAHLHSFLRILSDSENRILSWVLVCKLNNSFHAISFSTLTNFSPIWASMFFYLFFRVMVVDSWNLSKVSTEIEDYILCNQFPYLKIFSNPVPQKLKELSSFAKILSYDLLSFGRTFEAANSKVFRLFCREWSRTVEFVKKTIGFKHERGRWQKLFYHANMGGFLLWERGIFLR